jgi:hypothetical protein
MDTRVSGICGVSFFKVKLHGVRIGFYGQVSLTKSQRSIGGEEELSLILCFPLDGSVCGLEVQAFHAFSV